MAQGTVKFDSYDDSDDIEDYLERLELFLTANNVEEEKKVAHLLSGIGAKAYAVVKNLTAPRTPKECSWDRLKELLINHFKPKPPVIVERFAFHKRDQRPGETVNEFVIELRRLARTCNFGNFLDEALRDRLVCGLANGGTQKKLLSEKDLTLKKAVEVATATEMAVLEGPQRTTVRESEEVYRVNYSRYCQCCGKQGHSGATCRFRQSTCYKCGERGHLQVMCKQGKQSAIPRKAELHQLRSTNEEEDNPSIWTITGGQTEGYHVHLKLDRIPIAMELDTGAAVSVMSEQQWKETFTKTKPLNPYRGKPLHGYSGQEVQVVGQLMVAVEYGSQKRSYLYSLLEGSSGHRF